MVVCSPISVFSQSIKNNDDFVALMHEIGWRAWASCYRNNPQNNLISCLKNADFDDSIFNVIAQGISDCEVKRGRFSEENRKVVQISGRWKELVDFDADPKKFKQGEWDVVLLYNFLWVSMHLSPNQFTKVVSSD